MPLPKLPGVSESTKQKFIAAVKKHHNGVKWRVLQQEAEKALLYYIEVGPLSDEYLVEKDTTGDVEKVKLTTPEFFKIFDNEHIYIYDKIDADYLKTIVAKITGNKSDYNWRKWSKIIRESGRLIQQKGTSNYLVIRDKFVHIEPDLKESYDTAIKEKQLEYYIKPTENPATKIYKKLVPGQITSLEKICKSGKISEKEGKKVIDKLVGDHKLYEVSRGRWKVINPEAAKNPETSLFQADS